MCPAVTLRFVPCSCALHLALLAYLPTIEVLYDEYVINKPSEIEGPLVYHLLHMNIKGHRSPGKVPMLLYCI